MKDRLLDMRLNWVLWILLTLTLSACVPEATVPTIDDLFGTSPEIAQERIIYISSETIPCGAATCLLTRADEAGSWLQLEIAIIGFEYQENTAYTLRVREDDISGTTVLRLVDIVDQTVVEPLEFVETVTPIEAEGSAESTVATDTESSSEATNEATSETVSGANEETSEESSSDASTDTSEATTSSEATTEETEQTEQSEQTTSNTEEVIETITQRELLLFVDQVLGACSVDSDDRCLRVRENRSESWRNLSGVISGFNYVPGNYYVLRVLELTITTQNPNTEDTQTLDYSLVDLVSQTPATQEKLVYIGPEILSCDETATQLCYQYKESRSFDYEAKAMEIIGFNHQDGYAYALKLLASLDGQGQIQEYELIEIINQELLADGRFIEKVIYIGPELVACAYGPSELCYIFRESAEEPYRILSSEITGFRHQAGTEYEIKVRQKVSQADVENSTQALELVEILYQAVIEEVVEEVQDTEEVQQEEQAEVTEQTATEENTEVVEDTNTTEEATSPLTINETIEGAAQAQLENTANVEDVERRSVTITVAPPAQVPLAVPTPATSETSNTGEEAETSVEVSAVTEVTPDATTEATGETAEVITDEAIVTQTEENTEINTKINTEINMGEKTTPIQTVPVAVFNDIEPTDIREKIIFIGSSYQECENNGQPQLCYQSKDNLADDWLLLPYGIAGFDYKEGFVYVIRVLEAFYGDDPETGLGNYSLELVEILAETEDRSYSIAKEAERQKEEAAALEEAAIIAQTFEEEAAVLVDKEAEEKARLEAEAAKQAALEEQLVAQAQAIAADTQAALKLQEEAAAIRADTERALKLQEEAAAIRADTQAAAEAAKKAAEEEAAKKAQEEAAARKAEEEAAAEEAKRAEEAAAEAAKLAAEKAVAEEAAAEAQRAAEAEAEAAKQVAETEAQTEIPETITLQPNTTETKIVFIAEQLTTCQPEGMAQQLCYGYKENPEDEWQLLYNQIVNFDFFEGYIYELEVVEYLAADLPIELGRWFELVEMKNAFPVATGN